MRELSEILERKREEDLTEMIAQSVIRQMKEERDRKLEQQEKLKREQEAKQEEEKQKRVEEKKKVDQEQSEEKLKREQKTKEKLKPEQRKILADCYESDQTIKDVARKRRRTLEGLYKLVQRLRSTLFDCVQKAIREEEKFA